MLKSILDLVTQFVQVGGGLWLVWGAVVAGIGFRNQNGPEIQSGVWQIAGGGLILAAATLFKTIVIG